jgi:hypothetical protein
VLPEVLLSGLAATYPEYEGKPARTQQLMLAEMGLIEVTSPDVSPENSSYELSA